ncbi:MAG TPA: hypothetical protein VE868_04130 [Balneolaceae bacterium]|nr:hypothetical protein [Balneolaceae bacterium]
MLSQSNSHTERFRQLYNDIKKEVNSLKTEIGELEKENTQLRKELQEVREKEADMFSPLKETDRMALKHQVKGLISKIDEHLEDHS